mgnify:CR=1 FL=1
MAKFAKYLPEFGWQPTVFTVQPIVYWAQDESLLNELDNVRIIRTDSWDPQRLLKKIRRHDKSVASLASVKPGQVMQFLNQKVLAFFLTPDSKILWNPVLYKSITNLLHEEHFDAILTTSPPHSTHLVGKKLASAFGLVWIADFRDDWAGGHVVYEPTPLHRWYNKRLQNAVISEADAVISASPGIKAAFLESNRNCNAGKFHIITNGFDPADYPPITRKRNDNQFVLCYCGVISRFSDPSQLFMALLLLKEQYPASWKRLNMQFVGHDASGQLAELIRRNELGDKIETVGFMPHDRALQYVVNADALLLLATGNKQDTFIPGKTFEYFGAQKPVFGISNVKDTSELLQQYRMSMVVANDNPQTIAGALDKFMHINWQIQNTDLAFIEQFNRKTQTEQLTKILNGLVL